MRGLRLFLWAVGAHLVSHAPASAATPLLDGNTLYEFCTSQDAQKSAYCNAYVRGIYEDLFLDAVMKRKDPNFMCVRQTVTYPQIKDIVVAYMRKSPAERDGFAWVQVRDALIEAFPDCE